MTGPAIQMSARGNQRKKKKKAYQRDPDEGAPARLPARASDRGRRGARWDLASTAPTREDRRGAPRWQRVEEAGAAEVLLLLRLRLRLCPFACPGRAPGVCERRASLDERAFLVPGRLRAWACHLEGLGVDPEVGREVAA